MNRWTRGLGALWLVAGFGCDAPESLMGGLVIGRVEAHRLCDVDGVEVRLRAQWQACVPAEPECETPDVTSIDGDRFSCPSVDRTRELGVELPHPGMYRVEVSTVQVSGPDLVECFVDPDTGEGSIELPAARLSDAMPTTLDEHGPCS